MLKFSLLMFSYAMAFHSTVLSNRNLVMMALTVMFPKLVNITKHTAPFLVMLATSFYKNKNIKL